MNWITSVSALTLVTQLALVHKAFGNQLSEFTTIYFALDDEIKRTRLDSRQNAVVFESCEPVVRVGPARALSQLNELKQERETGLVSSSNDALRTFSQATAVSECETIAAIAINRLENMKRRYETTNELIRTGYWTALVPMFLWLTVSVVPILDRIISGIVSMALISTGTTDLAFFDAGHRPLDLRNRNREATNALVSDSRRINPSPADYRCMADEVSQSATCAFVGSILDWKEFEARVMKVLSQIEDHESAMARMFRDLGFEASIAPYTAP